MENINALRRASSRGELEECRAFDNWRTKLGDGSQTCSRRAKVAGLFHHLNRGDKCTDYVLFAKESGTGELIRRKKIAIFNAS